jgi:hypothetical protein
VKELVVSKTSGSGEEAKRVLADDDDDKKWFRSRRLAKMDAKVKLDIDLSYAPKRSASGLAKGKRRRVGGRSVVH